MSINPNYPESSPKPKAPLSERILRALGKQVKEFWELAKKVDAGDPHEGHLRAVMWGLEAPDEVPDDIMDRPQKSTKEF